MSFIEAIEELGDTFIEEQVEGAQEDAAKNIFERYRTWQNQVNGIDPNRSAKWNRQNIMSAAGGKRKVPFPQLEPGSDGYSTPLAHVPVYPPSRPPRQTVSGQITTYSAKAGGGSSMEIVHPHNSVLTSGLTNSLKYHDSNLLQSQGEKSLTRLNVKLGKQLYPDCITPFLKHLNGHGKVRMQFGGRILAKVNLRHVHMQAFRHRLSAGTDVVNAAWPAGVESRILGPNNTVPFIPAGPAVAGTTPYPVNTTSLRDINTGDVYYAPYNTADLEDLSWNLNSLKLGNPEWGAGIELPSFEPNVSLFVDDSHARQSRIAQNNMFLPDLPTVADSHTSPYRYNAVFNKGSILYNFMNKGLGGAKIDLIVYRIKKGSTQTFTGNTLANNSTQPFVQIADAIGAGYVATALAKAGTDELIGRPPVSTDVYTNPAFAFLPEMKRTLQSQMMFAEVSRQTFAMPSGSRREVNIVLPGSVYDPTNIPASNVPVHPPNYPQIFDQGTYSVVISVSGQKCTQELTETGSSFNIGDMYAGADIQFFATYTEHMGACQYKDTPTANMYSRGALLPGTGTSVPTQFKVAPITMLPQNQAVRIPANSATAGGSDLQNTIGPAA